jgi:hypothetical protein
LEGFSCGYLEATLRRNFNVSPQDLLPPVLKKPNRARRLDARKKMKLIDVLDRLHFADFESDRFTTDFTKLKLITNPSGAGMACLLVKIPIKYPPFD